MEERNLYLFEPVTIEIKDFPSEGYVLDIGGGGEGVIGRLKGKDVVAIDVSKEELEESAFGPLKVIMNARDLKFLDSSFNTASAFFSLMYLKDQEDHRKVFAELARVLKPGGFFHMWDVDLTERPQTDKEYYVVQIQYRVDGKEFKTSYGQKWPKEVRNEDYYTALAIEAGLRLVSKVRNQNTFYLVFQKI